jgi:hypothetical protein
MLCSFGALILGFELSPFFLASLFKQVANAKLMFLKLGLPL